MKEVPVAKQPQSSEFMIPLDMKLLCMILWSTFSIILAGNPAGSGVGGPFRLAFESRHVELPGAQSFHELYRMSIHTCHIRKANYTLNIIEPSGNHTADCAHTTYSYTIPVYCVRSVCTSGCLPSLVKKRSMCSRQMSLQLVIDRSSRQLVLSDSLAT